VIAVPTRIDWDAVDLDMLAYDMADDIERHDHPIDPTISEIRAELPRFLAALRQRAENRPPNTDDEKGPFQI
jgi:hypothetical protein